MFYVCERAKIICEELRRSYKRGGGEITGFSYRPGFFVTPKEAYHGEFADFDKKSTWAGEDDSHGWFTAEFTVPGDMTGKRLAFEFMTQERGWDATNPQFLLFIDGVPVQGLDTNHTECVIAEKAEAGRVYKIDLQGYSGQYKELRLIAKYYERNEDVYGLYMDIITAAEVCEKLDKNDAAKFNLENAITGTINLIDLVDAKSDKFLTSVRAAREFFDEEVYKRGARFPVTATAVGHTHIDVAWWWTVEQTREKAARSFATEVKLIEEYGGRGFKFMSSQPQLYKFVKERYPELHAKIGELIKAGKWEAEGGMWLEADCNLTSGESLARQFLHGKNYFKKEFGIDNVILWLPDVFGYSAALPQIMKLSGIKYFMTTKIAWNQFNKLPYDTFMWRGLDGTEILTHLITTVDPDQDVERQHFTTYNGTLRPGAVIGAWKRYQQKGINNDVLISFGHGDGGGGATRDMIEQGIRLGKGIEGAPKVRFATSRQYFDELSERVAGNRRLPTWAGELYLEYHRGTYTSMARNKRANRKTEFLLGELEFMAVWAERYGLAYPQSELLEMWELVLRNQFHDILPGSSIKEVYEVTKAEYAEIAEKAEKLLDERIAAVVPVKEGGVTALNTLHFPRGGLVKFAKTSEFNALTDGANVFPAQVTACGRYYVANVGAVPAKGYKQFAATNAQFDNPFTIGGNSVDTPLLTVEWDADGVLTRVYDKEARREVLKAGGEGNRLVVYEDKPMNFDNWDIDIYYDEKSYLPETAAVEVIERGPVRVTLRVTKKFHDSVITQKVRFYADTKRIDFDTEVDWKEHQCLLKAEFDVDINANEATYDIQFGNVKRPTHRNTSWDYARFEVCGHKFADVSEGGFGAALLNDCKYGYGIRDGKMTLSLIKSGTVPNPTTDREEHFFTYSLLAHKGGIYESDVIDESYIVNVPLRAVTGALRAGSEDESFVTVDADDVVLETIKKSFDGERTIIRLFENKNRRSDVTLEFNRPVKAAYESDIMESRGAEIAAEGNKIALSFKPFEIKTIEIVRE